MTAGETLSERVRARVTSADVVQFRDEACRHVVQQPYADNRYVRLVDDLRALLDTPAPAEPNPCGYCGTDLTEPVENPGAAAYHDYCAGVVYGEREFHERDVTAPAPAPVGDADALAAVERLMTNGGRRTGRTHAGEVLAAFAAAQRAEAEAYAAKCAAATVRALDEKADEYGRAERAEAKLARVKTALMQGGQTDRIRWSAAVAALATDPGAGGRDR